MTLESARLLETSAAAAPPVLGVRGLAHRYGARTVLAGLDFEVRRGEAFGLLGPNGAGKTTAFQILTGLLTPDAGSLVLEGRTVRPGARELRSRIGVVFQGTSLDGKLSGEENLLLAAALYGLRGAAAKARARELLELAELADRGRESVEKYSGGMRRRLEIARALVHRPALLLMDEPTSGLDEHSFQRIWAYLRARCAEGLSILLTTHRPEEAERCDRLGVLQAGRLATVDTPQALRERVSGDVIVVEADAIEELAAEVSKLFPGRVNVVSDRLHIERERAHELIPRLVEAFPRGRIRAVGLHRPTLADAFLKLTGEALEREAA